MTALTATAEKFILLANSDVDSVFWLILGLLFPNFYIDLSCRVTKSTSPDAAVLKTVERYDTHMTRLSVWCPPGNTFPISPSSSLKNNPSLPRHSKKRIL
jgi:hypothetical protein